MHTILSLLAFSLLFQATGQEKKTDRDYDELNGPVRIVRIEKQDLPDETGNPKVIYRVSGAGTSGIGGRRTRVNGVWQPEEQFVIDGMTDPDAFSLVEGEGGYHWSASNSTHGDYHALQGGNLTFTYMKRLNGAYFQSAVDFGALPNPITGTYTLHGLAQRVYGRQAYSVGVVWTNDVAGDLWFIKRRVEGY